MLVGVVLASVFCWADAGAGASIPADYRARLDQFASAARQLDSSGKPTPEVLQKLRQDWQVHTDQGDFNISSEGLQRDIRRYEKEKSADHAAAILNRIESLRRELDGFEKPPVDVSSSRADLDAILARSEFSDVHGPTWWDQLRQRILRFIFHILGRVIRATAIPVLSKYFVYALVALAVLALAYFAYRSIWARDRFEQVVPADLPVSAKEWALWLREAREAASRNAWRDAIHLAYWAGISFLESRGAWKPDRARTPREYLRLLSSLSEHRDTLTALTRTFELTWYAKRDANEATFSQTLADLEKLGCR